MKQERYTPITMTNYRLKPNLLLTCAAENPCLSCLILTQILQTEVKSQMSALNKRLQREPAFPDGSPARRAIMGAWKTSHPGGLPPSRRCPPSCSQASRHTASPRRPASEAQSPPSLGAGGPAEPPHAPAASARPEGTTDPSLRIRPSTVCNCRSSMRQPLLRHW